MPPLAHTKPCGVSVITSPLAMRTTRFACRSTSSTWRASRSQRSANAIASGRGSMVVRSATAPSAFETTFWVTTSTSSSRAGRAFGVASSAATMIWARSSPEPDLGDALERDDLQVVGLAARPSLRARRRRARQPRNAPSSDSAARRSAVVSSRARAGRRARRPRAGIRRGGAVQREAVRPERGLDQRPAGSTSSAFVPRAVPVGDDARRRRRGLAPRAPPPRRGRRPRAR